MIENRRSGRRHLRGDGLDSRVAELSALVFPSKDGEGGKSPHPGTLNGTFAAAAIDAGIRKLREKRAAKDDSSAK